MGIVSNVGGEKLIGVILNDWRANSRSAKARFFLTFFRLASWFCGHRSLFLRIVFGLPIKILYRFITDWIMCIDVPVCTTIGKGVAIHHAFGIVINGKAVLGENCTLRHNVTIGNKIVNGIESGNPVVGDNVEFGAGAVVVGQITVGSGSVISAGAVVTRDVKPKSIVYGPKAVCRPRS